MNLFQRGDFTLHSGEKSSFKIDCDALTEEDWSALAGLVRDRVPKFRSVWGVPTGGIRLAAQLIPYATGKWNDPTLIVDDVYTTGASMREAHSWVLETENVVGVVVFARNVISEEWVSALFTMCPRGEG